MCRVQFTLLQNNLFQGGEGEGSSGNTYSLFSPMSGSSIGMGTGPSRTVPHPLYPSASQPSGTQVSLQKQHLFHGR